MSGPEEAAQYLQRTNFKTLIEWLTASSILHRPEDPVQFCSDLLLSKLEERAGLGFDPDQANGYAQHVYQQASTAADEHGRLSAERLQTAAALGWLAALGAAALRNARLGREAERHAARLQALVDVVRTARASGTMGVNHLLFGLTRACPQIVGAEKCSVFVVDQKNRNLWSMQGDINFTIPMDKGIVGACATSGEIINIPDAYADERFNQEVDKKEGYKTNSILCLPIKDENNVTSGVIQVINKLDGPFLPEDEDIMGLFLTIAAPLLNNSQLFESVSSGGIVQDPNKKKGKDQGSDDKSSPKSQSPKQETTGESPREVTRKRLESRQPTEIIMEGNEEGEEEGA